ncbi:MAG: HD domain-containing protein [Anaerovorax sp.]|nr:HD domain-containing protein [Anaerovorax sp.]
MSRKKKVDSLLLYHDLIFGIVTALEARDEYTASHSVRVSDMTEQICCLLNLTEEEMETIHIAAHLHDIGKIGIEDHILRKCGPLNKGEWLLMKQHPMIGYEILKKVDRFEQIAVIVRHHHERWDGMGYPDGIKGELIPLGSRIIAITDSIDAMLNDRQYRKKMSTDECRTEIEQNIGIMYDPNISEVVLNNWEKIIKNEDEKDLILDYSI